MSVGGARERPEPRYLFPPLERRGVVLGLRAGSLVTLVGGAVIALGVLRSVPGATGVAVAAGLLLVAVAAGCWPVAGQPPVSWLPAVIGWAHRRGYQPRLDTEAGMGAEPVSRQQLAPGPPGTGRSPTAPAGIRLRVAPAVPGEAALGVIEDLAARSWAAVVPVRGTTLSLLDPEEQAHRLASWGNALAGAARAGSAVHRLQWVEQCGPADPGPLRRTAGAANGPPRAAASYRSAVEAEAPGTLQHQTWLVVAVRAPGRLRLRPTAPSELNAALRREVRLLRSQLRAGDLDAGAALDPAALGQLLRSACDPTRPASTVGSSSPGQPMVGVWPAAVGEGWASVRVDGAWQATYWIAEWPRLAVGPDMLSPLLLGGLARTMSVTMAPVQAERAVREVQSARTAALADDAIRSRAGFIDTIARRKEAEGVRRREAELAEGHADYRYSGYVTVSGTTEQALEEACAEVEQAARQCHLVVRRLYGRQAEARTWTLPLARGLS
ncbi:hypothetical protein K6U06_21455 [Acidiferrimicrobium sp. IK]|uniref:SCO6880 family protein n=1 Tax=Acidiferrimicrobium sp. IK TaxID=2871700 RepID=UPI0021CAE8DD|nr:SCO6880 family protein [Acidiferrimicrobium sp. IK]MCU4186947.1 hypothetical protein [Acidiferrimicrobium sp. IK]